MHKREKLKNQASIIGLLLIILLLAGVLGYYLRRHEPRFQPAAQAGPDTTTVSPVVEWDKLYGFRDYIIEQYYGPVMDKTLLEGALKGMVGALDEGGGEYFNAREYEEVRNRGKATHGTGLHLSVDEGSLIVISVDPGGEAEKAGVLPGDIIRRINGRMLSALDVERARNLLESNNNGHVELELLRGSEYLEIMVRLRAQNNPEVFSEVKGELGIIRIPYFYSDSGADFSKALAQLVAEDIQGLVFDLRNTPTGLLTEGVQIASQFIEAEKTVVSIRDTRDSIRDFLSESGEYTDLPLAVLINGQTEGTAEFIAGALGMVEGVTLIGEETLGGGRIYSYITLPGGEGIKLASGYLLLPNGEEIQDQSIEPDILVPSSPMNTNDQGEGYDAQMVRAMNYLRTRLDR